MLWCYYCNREISKNCDLCAYKEEQRRLRMEKSKTMGIIKLLPALQYVFPEVKNAFYRVDQDTATEYVTITAAATVNYKYPGDGPRYNFDICVTCDSVAAMYDDVWKECKRRFL